MQALHLQLTVVAHQGTRPASALIHMSCKHSFAHRYSDVTKQEVLKQAVARVVQSIIAALAAAVAGTMSTEDSKPTARLVLPTLAVMLEWWSLHPLYSM